MQPPSSAPLNDTFALQLTEPEWEKPLQVPSEMTCWQRQIIVCLCCSSICTSPFWCKLHGEHRAWTADSKTPSRSLRTPINHPAEPPVSHLLRDRGQEQQYEETLPKEQGLLCDIFPLHQSWCSVLEIRQHPPSRGGTSGEERKRGKESSVPRHIATEPLDLSLHQGEADSNHLTGHHTHLHDCSTSGHAMNFLL